MSRRYRKQEDSAADEVLDVIFDIGKTIPWWVSVPVAAILFIFVPIASLTPETIGPEPSGIVIRLILFLGSLFLKYLVPLALILGAIIGFVGKLNVKKCPQCGKTLTMRRGRHGKFLGCTGYPECNYTENL